MYAVGMWSRSAVVALCFFQVLLLLGCLAIQSYKDAVATRPDIPIRTLDMSQFSGGAA